MPDTSWGWTSYRKTGWVDRQDPTLKLYRGYFHREEGDLAFTKQNVEFWARRPIIALRHICNSGKDPATFEHQEVN